MDPYTRDGSTGVPAAFPSSQSAVGTAPLSAAAPTPASQPSAQSPVAAPARADDGDVIEAEWVDAVERTLTATQADPYTVNAAMAALRKDYLRKRYGKEAEQASQ